MVNAKMELQKTVTMNSEEIPNTFVIGHETSVNDWLKETFCTSNLKTDISLAIGRNECSTVFFFFFEIFLTVLF